MGGIVAIYALIGLMRLWRARFEEPGEHDFYASAEWPAMTLGWAVIAFAVAPFVAYFLAYLPQMIRAGTVVEFFAAQRRMIDIMTGSSATHPYSSLWHQWPAMTRPVWCLFQVIGGSAATWSAQHPAQTIVGLANPFLFYPGEAALLYCGWLWIGRRDVDGMIVDRRVPFPISAMGGQSEGAGVFLLLLPLDPLPRAGAGARLLPRRTEPALRTGGRLPRRRRARLRLFPAGAVGAVSSRP